MDQALEGKGCLPWNTLLEYRRMQHLEHNGARPLIKACTVPPETLWVNLMVEAIVRRTVISGNCIRNYYCIIVGSLTGTSYVAFAPRRRKRCRRVTDNRRDNLYGNLHTKPILL